MLPFITHHNLWWGPNLGADSGRFRIALHTPKYTNYKSTYNVYKKPRESCFCYEIYTEYSVSMRSQCEPQYPPAITQHLMFTKHPNIWSMIQAVLLSSPLTRLHISYTCKLNFVQIVRKVFSIPLRCKIYEKGNCTRQMWTANCPPCSQIGPVQAAFAHCMSSDYQMIGQWPKACLVMLAFTDCLACRAVCELFGLSRAQKGVVHPQRAGPTASPLYPSQSKIHQSS